MDIPVLLEPIAGGFRASLQSPVAVAAEGATQEEALAALSKALWQSVPAGGTIRTLGIHDLSEIQEIAARMRANPLYPEYERAIEEYRKKHNVVPDAD